MSYVNFKPTIWSAHLQSELAKECVLVDPCWKLFQGEVKQGAEVKILGIGRPTIKKYTPGKDIDRAEEVETSSVYLKVDQYYYFNIGVDNIDEAQSKLKILPEIMKETKHALAENRDSFVAKHAKEAGYIADSPGISTAEEAVKVVDEGLLWLRKNDVPQGMDIRLEIPWFMYYLMLDKYIELDTDNSNKLATGKYGYYKGTKVKPCNNLFNDGTDDYLMMRTEKAIAFASTIDKMKPYEPEKGFAEAIKGLDAFGAKVIRPKELYAAKVHSA